MARFHADTITVLTGARRLIVERGWSQNGPTRTRDGAHVWPGDGAGAFSPVGALWVACELAGHVWPSAPGMDAARALQIAIAGDKSPEALALKVVADWNDSLSAETGRAAVIAKLTESIGVVNGRKPRPVRQGDAA
jgi:hypothetical protein